jgi:hypothetical protein
MIRGDAGRAEGMITDLRLDAGGFHDRDAVQKRPGLVGGEDRRLALFDDIFWAAHGMGRIDVNYMPGDELVQQHAERGQVLLDGRRRHLALQGPY